MSSARDKEINQKVTESEIKSRIPLLEKIAFEKCRTYRYPLINTNKDSFIWGAKECEQASKAVVKEIDKLIEIQQSKRLLTSVELESKISDINADIAEQDKRFGGVLFGVTGYIRQGGFFARLKETVTPVISRSSGLKKQN